MKMEILFRRFGRSLNIGRPRFADFVAPAIGILAIGIASGAALVMLLAPATAKEARERAERQLRDVKSRLLTEQSHPNKVAMPGGNAVAPQHRS
jgi:hypothetical protein